MSLTGISHLIQDYNHFAPHQYQGWAKTPTFLCESDRHGPMERKQGGVTCVGTGRYYWGGWDDGVLGTGMTWVQA